MKENLKICVDRLLPQDLMAHHMTVAQEDPRPPRAISPKGKTWIRGSELHVRFLEGTSEQRFLVQQQAKWWLTQPHTPPSLRLLFDDSEQAEIRIAFDPADGAWSYIGTDNAHIPLDQPTMNLGFLDGGTAAHEFGHAIGLAHEHQSPFTGGITWNEEVVIHDLSGPPNRWTIDQIRHNVLDKYTFDQVNGTAYDPASIMLYFFPGTWISSGVGTTANSVLSDVDKQFVSSTAMYPKAPPAQSLAVDAHTRTSAAIGAPGEEDLFTFTVHDGGRYVVDTRGPTDLYLKLYGPDSQTTLIAEDDDSGVGSNPRVSALLVPGQYCVQVRHRNQAAGVGQYTIKVRTQAS